MLSRFGGLFGDKMKVIWYNWVALLILEFAFVICSFAAAVGSSTTAYGFFFIWNMLCSLAYDIGGTAVLRNIAYRTPLAVGAVIGVGAMMVQLMLVNAVISNGHDPLYQAMEALTAFSVLKVLGLTTFVTFVVLFRDILLPAPMATMEHETSLPPPQFQAGGSSYGGTGASGDIGGPPVSASGSYRDEHVTVTTVGVGGGGVL